MHNRLLHSRSPASTLAGFGRTRLVGGALLALLLVATTGCPPTPGVAPTSRREALVRVNENLGQLNKPLQCSALVSFHFRDAQGTKRSFIGHEAALIYAAPRSLRFDMRALTGVVAQFGSNDERYWVWIEPEVRKLWWGRWRGAEALSSSRRLPVPPNDLFDALMLRPLPESLEGGLLPMLRVEGNDHRLLFTRLGLDGQPLGLREVRLDPQPPYQPVEIIDRLPDGETAMHATLQRYERVGADGPFTPRRYVVEWPQNGAELRLDILGAKFRSELDASVFEFPSGWNGEVECIDSADAAAPSANPRSAGRP